VSISSNEMFDLFLGAGLLLLPLALGLRTRSYWSLILPGGVFALAVREKLGYEPSGDEIDAWVDIYLVGGALSVLACLAGIALGRRLNTPSP
jgi:hypothetical protein